ncbi:MAG: WD40 repeat domain-containing protein, partial [Gemmataceae bacterium]|nr:WD40 repeat domain-containing protein [Gemmataceae bacterium]
LAVLAGAAFAADDPPKDKDKDKEPDAKELAALIDKLGDDDIDKRKDAEKGILEIGEPALPALRKAAAEHADADVKLRAIVLQQKIKKGLYGELRKFVGHAGDGDSSGIRGIAVTSDGKRAITAGTDQKLIVWDLDAGKQVREITGHEGWCWEVAISKDDKECLSSGTLDGTMRLWDIGTGKELKKYKGHASRVYGVAFSPDGKHVASGGADKETTIRIFDRASGDEVRKLEGHTGYVWRIAYSPDGKKLASIGLNDRSLRVWDAETGKALFVKKQKEEKDEKDPKETKEQQEAREAREAKEAKDAHDGYVVSLSWSPDGKRILTGGRDPMVKLWDAEKGELIRSYPAAGGDPEAIAFSPDGKRFLASADRVVNVFDTATGKIVHRFEDHTETVFAVAWTPDGRKALSAGRDKTLRLWGVPR